MKVAQKLIFLFKDDTADAYSSAFSEALQPNTPSTHRRLEESFELSLERYGIRNVKASGDVCHFVDQDGNYQVTLLLFQNNEPPVLACALNEVLTSIIEDNLSAMPTVVVPVVISASKIKLEKKYPTASDRDQLYGVQIGPESDTTRSLLAKCEKPPPSLQIHYEPLACFLQLACVSKLSTCAIIGHYGQSRNQKHAGNEIEVVHVIGELLANTCSFKFSREKIRLNLKETPKDVKEPWQALYG